MSYFLEHVGFQVRNPKRPSIESILESAPDLIVVDWEPAHERANAVLVNEIRQCASIAGIPILVSASTRVERDIRDLPRLVVLENLTSAESTFNAMKLLGFGDLKFIDLESETTDRESGADASNVDERPSTRCAERILKRMPLVIRQLSSRYNNRPKFEISDEYDLQDLLHAVLHVYYDDIRLEETTPSYGGSHSRMDFLLRDEMCVIETKMTRKGLEAKEVGEQLMIDIERYKSHPNCKTLLCLIYDPEHRVKNPRGLEADLSGKRDAVYVKVFVVPTGS